MIKRHADTHSIMDGWLVKIAERADRTVFPSALEEMEMDMESAAEPDMPPIEVTEEWTPTEFPSSLETSGPGITDALEFYNDLIAEFDLQRPEEERLLALMERHGMKPAPTRDR